MEKQQSKVILQHLELVDENNSLINNLVKLISPIHEIVNKLKLRSEEIDKKHLRSVLKYEILLLEKLIEFNNDLDSFWELNSSNVDFLHETNCNEPLNGLEKLDLTTTVTATEVDSTKDTVQKFNEKLFSQNTITSLKDFYNKPSTSSAFEYQTPEKDVEESFHSLPISSNDQKKDIQTVEIHPSDSSDSQSDQFLNSKIVNSAIDKLNNTKFSNRQEEAVANLMSQVTIEEDFKLEKVKINKSPENVIKNTLKASTKLRKKKNRKQLEVAPKITEVHHFDIKEKGVPIVGTECAFSHIESPSEFYIHVADLESSLIDNITDEISEYFQNTSQEFTTKDEAAKCIGKYGAVFVENYKGWYRCEILNWYLEQKTDDVLLQLIDYGNKSEISYRQLRMLTQSMAEIQKLCIKCHLPLLYPPNYTVGDDPNEWPMETIDALTDISGLFPSYHNQNKLFKIVYAVRNPECDSVAIDLHSLEMDEEHTVGQTLLDLKLAKQITYEVDENNLELEEFIQDVDEMEHPENINEAILGYDARDEARICPFTKPDGTCYKGKHCKLEHLPLSKDGYTEDTIPVFRSAFNSLLLPKTGSTVNILITHPINSCTYFAQIVRKPKFLIVNKNGSKCTVSSKMGYYMDADFYSLLEVMNLPKTVSSYEKFKVWPSVGEIIVVKHWTKKWLRAIVRNLEMDQDGYLKYVQVFMLDFGETVDVLQADIRQISDQFLHLPFQAIECYLYNYKEKKGINQKKAKDFLIVNVTFRNFVAQVMSNSLPLRVGIQSSKGEDIGKKLEEVGLAIKCDVDYNADDNCILSTH